MINRMSFFLLLLLGALLLVCSGCQRKPTRPAPAPSAPNTTPYSSAQGYVIDIPNGWTFESEKPQLIDLLAMEPMTSPAVMMGNISVAVENTKLPLSVDQYYSLAKDYMKKSTELPRFAEVSTTDFTGNAYGKKMVYTWMLDNVLPVKVGAYMFTNGKKAYVVSCSMTTEEFSKYEALYDQIGTSFRWKE